MPIPRTIPILHRSQRFATSCSATIRKAGILSCLAPTGQLFGVWPPLPAEGTQIGAAETGRLDYGGQLVRGTPLFRCLVGSWNQLSFLLPAMPPAVEGMDINPCGASDLGHALPTGLILWRISACSSGS